MNVIGSFTIRWLSCVGEFVWRKFCQGGLLHLSKHTNQMEVGKYTIKNWILWAYVNKAQEGCY
jgi:hypothetical protein